MKIEIEAVVGILLLALAGFFIEATADYIGLPLAGAGLYYIIRLAVKKETPASASPK